MLKKGNNTSKNLHVVLVFYFYCDIILFYD